MATIKGIILAGKGKAGSNDSWRVEENKGEFQLWHYGTLMLEWDDTGVLGYSVGNGSVSDQGGMNTAFKVLGFPYRFDRKGGARITEL